MNDEFAYVFTIRAKRRKRPNYNYTGILRTHRYYVEYYSLLRGENPIKAVNGEPKISFPGRFIETLVNFAKDLDGKIVAVKRVKIPRKELYYEKPIVLLPDEIAFRRHMLFSITASTYRKAAKLNSLRELVLYINANFLNILTSIAIDRYNELIRSSNPAWHWYMLRVGRALKVLYKLD